MPHSSNSHPLIYNECEIKFELTQDEWNLAMVWLPKFKAFNYMDVSGTDVYYRQGRNVVRHRQGRGGAGQLTVKQRLSSDSISNRVEVDLNFAKSMRPQDITAFLGASGWRREVALFKRSHIWWFLGSSSHVITCALYYVQKRYPLDGDSGGIRYFLEVEVEKESRIGIDRALAVLGDWHKRVLKILPRARLQDLSLYELYSGHRYRVAKPEKE